ncbi:MAG: cation diffusion facilitator family transporter [Acetobacteraceae bacterium]
MDDAGAGLLLEGRAEGREDHVQRLQRIAIGSIFVGLVILVLKGLAWWVTGSAALYSDALETLVNVAAAALTFGAIRLAAKPADTNHPYGHGKAEFFAAVIEGVLIVVAALLILSHAWHVWQHPLAISTPFVGIGLNALATCGNAAWATLLLREGRRASSPALAADGRHLFTDVVTSIAVIVGLIFAVRGGLLWLDPVLAVAVAFYILFSGWKIIRSSVGGLMDEAPDAPVRDRIRALVADHATGAIEAHDLRTRSAGHFTYLEFHLVVPGEMRVDEAHAICDRIEEALRTEMGNLVVTIHVEPEVKAKQHGVPVL